MTCGSLGRFVLQDVGSLGCMILWKVWYFRTYDFLERRNLQDACFSGRMILQFVCFSSSSGLIILQDVYYSSMYGFKGRKVLQDAYLSERVVLQVVWFPCGAPCRFFSQCYSAIRQTFENCPIAETKIGIESSATCNYTFNPLSLSRPAPPTAVNITPPHTHFQPSP